MGMVKFGDKLMETNWDLLSKCCSVNGQILKPSKSMGLTDLDLHGNGETNTGFKGSNGPVRWQTYSDVELEGITGQDRFIQNIIMTWNLKAEFKLPIKMLESHGGTTGWKDVVMFQSYPLVTTCINIDSEVIYKTMI